MSTGQHIDREDRYERTGMTTAQRRERVRQLVNAGWSERRIAKHLKIGASTAHYIVAELKGRPRRSVSVDMCDSCWADFPAEELSGGLCPRCKASGAQLPGNPPREQW